MCNVHLLLQFVSDKQDALQWERGMVLFGLAHSVQLLAQAQLAWKCAVTKCTEVNGGC